MDNIENFIFVEKYRPQTLEDIILPEKIENIIKRYLKEGDIPHLLFNGDVGIGKTSLAKALPSIFNRESMFINASLDNSLDMLRNTIKQFSVTMSLEGTRKFLIFDEIDSKNNPNFLPALRPFIEEYSDNVSFIATCNNFDSIPGLIKKALKSRFQIFDFEIKDKKQHAGKIFKRVKDILDNEKISYKDKVIVEIITKKFPDIRDIIDFCQQYAHELTNDNLIYKVTKAKVDLLFKCLKEGDFTKIWEIVLNEYNNLEDIYEDIYKNLKDYLIPNCIGDIILCIADYAKWHNSTVYKEAHIVAMLYEISDESKGKKFK